VLSSLLDLVPSSSWPSHLVSLRISSSKNCILFQYCSGGLGGPRRWKERQDMRLEQPVDATGGAGAGVFFSRGIVR
jgi:hypothetical protein